ncbi:hypothetical protein SAMN05216275_1698 [Streptosporangium canum]|uniref:Uncharacterized protein n=1 Tax=Streptosporangium canum TaxID=324952 RepID=A0A1I4FPN7_9ACTN|nr:hypothetical protein [Streptosporangium canum]SFL19812.1 hypothetical protein SAMN05216275_1698 [Streptosporangium canum]
MKYKPYTYVTAVLRDGVTRLDVAFSTSEVGVLAAVTSNQRPFLDLSTPEAQISVSTTGAGPVTEQDVTLAREIFNAAARYLADCERLHTEQAAAALPGLDEIAV